MDSSLQEVREGKARGKARGKAKKKGEAREEILGRGRVDPQVGIPHRGTHPAQEVPGQAPRAIRPPRQWLPNRAARVPGRGPTGIHGQKTTPMYPIPPVKLPSIRNPILFHHGQSLSGIWSATVAQRPICGHPVRRSLTSRLANHVQHPIPILLHQ